MGKYFDRMHPTWLIDAEPESIGEVVKGMAAQKRCALWHIFKGAGLTNLPSQDDSKTISDIPCIILAWVCGPIHSVSSAEEIHRLLPNSELIIAQGNEDFKTIPQRMRDLVTTNA